MIPVLARDGPAPALDPVVRAGHQHELAAFDYPARDPLVQLRREILWTDVRGEAGR